MENSLKSDATLWVALHNLARDARPQGAAIGMIVEGAENKLTDVLTVSHRIRPNTLRIQYDLDTVISSLKRTGGWVNKALFDEAQRNVKKAAGFHPQMKTVVELQEINLQPLSLLEAAVVNAWLERAVAIQHIELAAKVERFLEIYPEDTARNVLGRILQNKLEGLQEFEAYPDIGKSRKNVLIREITHSIKAIGDKYDPMSYKIGVPVITSYGISYAAITSGGREV